MTQPAFQRWNNVRYQGWINVELPFDFANWINVDIVTLIHRWNHDIDSLLKSRRRFNRLTFIMGELWSFCRRWLNVELGVDFEKWINVDNTTLFHRRTLHHV